MVMKELLWITFVAAPKEAVARLAVAEDGQKHCTSNSIAPSEISI